MLTLSIPLCLGIQASLALQKRTAPSQSPQQTHRPVSGRGSGSVGSVCVCVCMCFSDPLTHHSQFLTHGKGSLAWTLLDSLALSLSLTLVLPHIIVCFTNFFFYSSHRTGHSVKSHMLYRIQTVLFVTFSLESVSVIFFLIHISDFA